LVDVGLRSLTVGISFHIFFDELLESRSFIQFLYELLGVGNPRMSCNRGIIQVFEDLVLEVKVVFKETFLSKEGVGQKNTGFISIHPPIKVRPLGKQVHDHIGLSRKVLQGCN